MKKVLVFALLALTIVSISSCSKEDRIVGKWKITHASGDLSDDKGGTWTFKEKGTCSFTLFELDFEGEWSISKDNLTIDCSETRNGSKVNISGDFEIDNLTSSEMSLSGEWIVKVDDEKDKIKVSYDFEKK